MNNEFSRKKAIEYAKEKYKKEYDNAIFHREVINTINDFESGFLASLTKEDLNIESIFSNILSFYVPDGNPEIFKQKIEQYKSEVLSL